MSRRHAVAILLLALVAGVGCQGEAPPPPDPLKPEAEKAAKMLADAHFDQLFSEQFGKGEQLPRLSEHKVFGREQAPVFMVGGGGSPPTYHYATRFFLEGKDEAGTPVALREKLVMTIVKGEDGIWYQADGHFEGEGALHFHDKLGHWFTAQGQPAMVAFSPYLLVLFPFLIVMPILCLGEAAVFVYWVFSLFGLDRLAGGFTVQLWNKFHLHCAVLSLLVTLAVVPWVANRTMDAFPSKLDAVTGVTAFVITLTMVNLFVLLHGHQKEVFGVLGRCWLLHIIGVVVLILGRWAGWGPWGVIAGGAWFLVIAMGFLARAGAARVPGPARSSTPVPVLEAAFHNAVIRFVSTFGRNPTQSEMETLLRGVVLQHQTSANTPSGRADPAAAGAWTANSLLALISGLALVVTGVVFLLSR